MTLIVIFSALLFAAVSAAVYSVWTQTSAEKDSLTLRLRQLRGRHNTPEVVFGDRPPLLLELIARLGGFMPAREGRDALRTGLISAGFRQPQAVLVFLGFKIILAVLLPIAWVVYAYATGRPAGNIATGTLVAVAAGFYLPTMFVAWRRSKRHDALVAALPDALDLLVVCVEAGLGIGAAIHRVAQELKNACPELAGELVLVNREMQTGISRSDALRNLASRTGVDEIYALVAMLIQTDRLGTSVAQALRVHADSMRTRRRQRAEQLARKAAIKLTFPLVFLILPALLVIILGPAAIVLVEALIRNH
jgi:tight adherence protein C